MATKKINPEQPAKTVLDAAAAKIAAEVFAGNPDMSEVHIASDGTAFFTANDAKNYAHSLKDNTVVSVKRTDANAGSDN